MTFVYEAEGLLGGAGPGGGAEIGTLVKGRRDLCEPQPLRTRLTL